jgi:hypothetical protein
LLLFKKKFTGKPGEPSLPFSPKGPGRPEKPLSPGKPLRPSLPKNKFKITVFSFHFYVFIICLPDGPSSPTSP